MQSIEFVIQSKVSFPWTRTGNYSKKIITNITRTRILLKTTGGPQKYTATPYEST